MKIETLVQRHLDRWIYLLGLSRWRITWDVVDGEIDQHSDGTIARNDYKKTRSGARVAHIRFSSLRLKTRAQVEQAVVHELIHLLDHGIGNDAHKLIYRLEKPLVRVRQRLSKR